MRKKKDYTFIIFGFLLLFTSLFFSIPYIRTSGWENINANIISISEIGSTYIGSKLGGTKLLSTLKAGITYEYNDRKFQNEIVFTDIFLVKPNIDKSIGTQLHLKLNPKTYEVVLKDNMVKLIIVFICLILGLLSFLSPLINLIIDYKLYGIKKT